MSFLKKDVLKKTATQVDDSADEDNTMLSLFDVSIEHPRNWKIIFSPKMPPDYNEGFIRIENFIPRRGAEISLSINWKRVSQNADDFSEAYCEKIRDEYAKHMKKKPYELETTEIIDFRNTKAAYVVTEYKSGIGLIKRSADIPVRMLQLAFLDESTKRAVVSSVIGVPEIIKKRESFLKGLVFSVDSHCHKRQEDEC